MEDLKQDALFALKGARVVHLDNHLLVLDKPAGVLSQSAEAGDDNLQVRGKAFLKIQCDKPGNVYLGLVHRLDRNVSGLMVFARTSKAAARLSNAFLKRTVDKRYLAFVKGTLTGRGDLEHRLLKAPDERGVIESSKGKTAKLSYRTLATGTDGSLLEVELHTGRKHQIRAQLAFSGHPIVGDPLYGSREVFFRRPALLAGRLGFTHPVGGESVSFQGEIPRDLRKLLTHAGSIRAAEEALRTP